MKKKCCILLVCVLCLLPALSALADTGLTGRPVADGVVQATQFVDVTAPYSGTLAPFDWQSGDTVAAGDELFSFVTTNVYASEDGVVKGVFIQPGDDAAAAMQRYGAVMGIEPAQEYMVQATTTGATNDDEYKILHLGETLYFRTGANGDEGTGIVTQVAAQSYRVDVQSGLFDLNAAVTLYRQDSYSSKYCVGKGTVTRRDALLVSGSGRVSAVYVQSGDTVKSGDLLASFVSADAAPGAYAPALQSNVTGVLHTVAVSAGQQVWKGQVLCRVDLTDTIEVAADVDETDLGGLAVGDTLPITLDIDEDTVLTGTVTEISALGQTRLNAAYFTVHVQLPAGSAPLGVSASVYLPEK